MAKKSLLLIVPFSALPKNSGGKQRVWHTIYHLYRDHELTVWSFPANDTEVLLEKNWYKKLGITYRGFSLNSSKWFSFLRTFQPFWFSPWWNDSLITQTRSIKIGEYDHIQVEGTQLLYLGKYVPKNIPNSYVAYDVSFISFWRRLKGESNILKKIVHLWRLLEIYVYEKFYISKFDQVVTVSKTDAEFVSEYFGIKNSKVIPNGIDSVNFLPNTTGGEVIRLGYIGGFAHPPNLEAVRFILQKILPELERKNISYELLLCGEQDPRVVESLSNEYLLKKNSVRVLGFVDDLANFYGQIDLLLAPIFSGSGTRVKILESLSFARPVLTTKIGAEGLDITTAFLRIISAKKEKDPTEWCKEIVSLKGVAASQLDKRKLVANLKPFLWKNALKNTL